MKFIPILFSTSMVQAILEGRKTQTRRVVKPQPSDTGVSAFNDGEHPQMKCPYGKPGDILWVREKCRIYYSVDENGCADFSNEIVEYSADNPPLIPEMDGDGFQVFRKDGSEKFIPWKPSIHMPKEACRIFLRVKSVRVERLHDITPSDACDEGVEYWNVDAEMLEGGELQADFMNYTWTEKRECDPNYEDRWFPSFPNSVDSFRTLWQSINGKDSWKANPWVWVIEFERIEKPENFI